MLNGATFLVTGGTGSFGNHVVQRLLKESAHEIRILSRDEKKQDDMRKQYSDPRLRFFIGDVRDISSVKYAVEGVDFIFHAAALKQVPSCDFYPLEAVKTNVLGASNVLQAARDYKVKRAIVLSTDKAVYPVNAMGMSKALMEKVMVAESRTSTHTVFSGTRYGNVIASRGSVIPLFIQQIKDKLPITITDPKMTRFLMSLEEAVDLVFHAFENGKQGDIFVQKSPAADLLTIANAVCQMMGVEPNIKLIGTRHGEKLHETLVNREELVVAQDSERYFRIPCDTRDLNYALYFKEGKDLGDEYNSANTQRLSLGETIELLKKNKEVLECLK
jgi:UDP-N-acetylglucosamine 4,6-dehydratase